MASGTVLAVLLPQHNEPHASGSGTEDRKGTVVPHPVLDLAIDEFFVTTSHLPPAPTYNGGGVTVSIEFSMSSATEGYIKVDGWIVPMTSYSVLGTPDKNDTGDVEVDGSTNNIISATITIPHADLNNATADASMRILLQRINASGNGQPDAAGDMEIRKVTLRET